MTGNLNYEAVRARNAERVLTAEQYRLASASDFRIGSAPGRSGRSWKRSHRQRLGLEIVRRSIAAYNRSDLEALGQLHHPDAELDWSASRGLEAGVYRGREAVMRFHRRFLDTFQAVVIEPDSFIGSGDSVIVPNAAHVRGRGGIAAIARSALVFEVRSGQIVRLCLYQETGEALEAAGLSE